MRAEGNIEETKEVEKPKKENPPGVKTVGELIEEDKISMAVLLMENRSMSEARKYMREMKFTKEEIKAAKDEYLTRKEMVH